MVSSSYWHGLVALVPFWWSGVEWSGEERGGRGGGKEGRGTHWGRRALWSGVARFGWTVCVRPVWWWVWWGVGCA